MIDKNTSQNTMYRHMKRINSLFISIIIGSASVFAQEMPADLSAKLEAKAAEVNAGNSAAAKTWLRKQVGAWETIQNMSFAADESDIKLIKEIAEKKYPLDYVNQEKFINEQSIVAAGLPEFKVALGKDGYEAVRKKFFDSGKTDLNELVEILRNQAAAKTEIDSMKPIGDEMTFAITKEVVAKKFAGDYVSQLAFLKKQSAPAATAPAAAATSEPQTSDNAVATTTTLTSETAVMDSETAKRPMNISELNKIARDIFSKETFVVEGARKCTAVAAEIEGKQVILMPFTAYSPDSSITVLNNLGEEVQYDKDSIFACKDLPLMLIFAQSVPADTLNVAFPTDNLYRDLIGKNVFFVGFTTNNIQSFPVKINAISDPIITLSTRIPTNFQEGTILLDAESGVTLGILTINNPIIKNVNWKNRSEVNKFLRSLDTSFKSLNCIRIDRLGEFEKVESERFKAEQKKIAELKVLALDVIKVLTNSRIDELSGLPVIGKIVNKHKRDMMRKQEKSRFDRLGRQYLQDIITLIKVNLKDYNPNEFYTAHRVNAIQYQNVLNDFIKTFDNALRSGNFKEFLPYEANRIQEK